MPQPRVNAKSLLVDSEQLDFVQAHWLENERLDAFALRNEAVQSKSRIGQDVQDKQDAERRWG